jgi:transposase
MGFIRAEREQMDMLGYSLEEFVEQKSECRWLVGVLRQLDLKEFYGAYSEQGGDAYDPEVMLAIWLMAYREGHTSTRKIEQLCRRDLHYIYLSGNLKPDHCALSRFRRRHREHFHGVLVDLVRLARDRGVADFRRISVDGSKIQAGASKRQSRKKSDLQKELKAAREEMKAYLEECEANDEVPDEAKVERAEKRERQLSDAGELLEQRASKLQSKDRDSHQVNLVEPEARVMKGVNGRSGAPAYNAQIAVDEATGFIGAAYLSDETNDRKEFEKIHAQNEANTGPDDQRHYTADSGYHSYAQLEYVQAHQADAIIAEPKPADRDGQRKDSGKLSRGHFEYDKHNDCYICPAGRELAFESRKTQRGRELRIYASANCAGCALRKQCLNRPEDPGASRRIYRDRAEELAESMFERSCSPEGQKRLKQRSQSVEPVFGNLKHNKGFRRFKMRGLRSASGEFALMCIGHNLAILAARMQTHLTSARLWAIHLIKSCPQINSIDLNMLMIRKYQFPTL